jgi:hypothetical protein
MQANFLSPTDPQDAPAAVAGCSTEQHQDQQRLGPLPHMCQLPPCGRPHRYPSHLHGLEAELCSLPAPPQTAAPRCFPPVVQHIAHVLGPTHNPAGHTRPLQGGSWPGALPAAGCPCAAVQAAALPRAARRRVCRAAFHHRPHPSDATAMFHEQPTTLWRSCNERISSATYCATS